MTGYDIPQIDVEEIVAPDDGCLECGSVTCAGQCVFSLPTAAWADVGGVE